MRTQADTIPTVPEPEGSANTGPESVPAAGLPDRVGRYRVERLLGEGGFGRVYLAHDDVLHRPVAVKVPHRHRLAQPADVEAYLAEARALASLDHPHIVPVHDVGRTDDGLGFVVSKFIEGSDLKQALQEARLSFHEAAALVATVADALHHAHGRGLVHRDVKPGNILLDRRGQPFVVDFGLALREQDAGAGPCYAGTPAYMSPEQARGEGHRVDGRSDIFSLGIVLYELLTGRRPFPGKTSDELRAEIISLEPRPPRQVDDRIPKELERICLKALAKRASERYTTAWDLADDLRHFLQQSTVAEQPPAADGRRQTADGKEAAAEAPPSGSGTWAGSSSSPPLRIVPKGLRSFDAHDADFFLELLPGLRDRAGLPESIRFWKTRIEETDPDQAFAVGLLYGPSGCGKSSLVRAGLLPRLGPQVRALYVEATAADTETRLLKGLRRVCPDLPPDLDLAQTLAAVRQGRGLPPGQKLLLVLDQFEQWLHARKEHETTALVYALRQCDGSRVQCLLLVRDDFWLAVSRFMADLEVELVQGRNLALVDLFDRRHARRVLAAFGRAFGALDAHDRRPSREQEAFVEQVVAGLDENGKVICVRLALFAEMMKGRPWTRAALREVGGARGVGVAFLEDAFGSAAGARYRPHRHAARAVLKALLPESGTQIKGTMRSRAELLAASGYAHRPQDFEDLLRILDGELRLLTPTDPEGIADCSDESAICNLQSAMYYQLTHDYLVPSLREWLTRQQKATRRGRAELRLADRAALWQAKREGRQLPSLAEWLTIRLWTAPRTWTGPERQMMRAAARKHLTAAALVATLAFMLAGLGLVLRGWEAESRDAARAHEIVRGLLNAKLTEAPAIIGELSAFRRWADPELERVVADPSARRDCWLRARLALLPVDPGQVGPLRDELLDADARDFPVLRDALAPHADELAGGLWDLLATESAAPSRRFRAAAALAAYAPADPRWDQWAPWVADQLVRQQLELPWWVDALRPVGARLTPPLAALFREAPATGAAPAAALGDYAADQPDVLADLLGSARPDPPGVFAGLFTRLARHGDRAVAAVAAALDRTPEGGGDPNAAAARRANLAIALLRLGAGARLWPLLKASPDPRCRSYLIDRLGPLGGEPGPLVDRLAAEPDDSVRAALLLALGGFDDQALPPARRAALAPMLARLYREDGSAAVHAAAGWLLGRWGQKPEDRPTGDANAGRGWYVNASGMTMVRIAGPVSFLMGAAPGESTWADEKQHPVTIANSYDIGMTEVTVAQFRRYWRERHGDEKWSPGPENPGERPDAPATRVTWYEAAAFCNWLSEREGIPQDQWCYEPNSDGKYADGMTIAAGFASRRGYRLPTEAEWEYACRGGATTSRCYGDAVELLPRYAWYAANSGDKIAPVARLLPNAFGLFDVHGNTVEWCQDRYRTDPDRPDGPAAETVRRDDYRAARGGHYMSYAGALRSAKRFADRPSYREAGGFRLARSRP